MGHSLPRYQPSGFFRATTIAIFVAAIAGGVLVAWLYQMMVRWIPYVQLKMLVVFGFAGVLAFGGWQAVRLGHCRNRMIAAVLALALAGAPLAASYYWDYRALVSSVAEQEHISVDDVKQELSFGRFLELKQEWGWKMKSSGSAFNGWGVLFIWTLEGLIVFAVVLGVTLGAVGEPYCEKCNRFCTGAKFGIYGVGRAAADPLLAAGALDGVINLQPPSPGDSTLSLTLTVTTCPTCKQTGFLSVAETRVTMKRNKTQTTNKSLIKHAVLSTQNREAAVARLTQAIGQKLSA